MVIGIGFSLDSLRRLATHPGAPNKPRRARGGAEEGAGESEEAEAGG